MAGTAFAQENTADVSAENTTETENTDLENTAEENKTSSAAFGLTSLRAGIFGSYTPAIGSLSDYVSSGIGGGLSLECDFPLKAGENPSGLVKILKLFGFSFRASGNINPVKVETLSSMWNAQASLGLYARLPLFVEGLYFQPELDYGVVMNFPSLNPAYPDNELSAMYIDQLIQLGLGIRYSNEKILNGRLEFEFAPTYTFCAEKSYSVNYIGGRLGVIYSIL